MENSASRSLYDLLVTKDFDIEIFDSQGKPVDDPGQAEMFSFNWKTENHDYGTVVILVGDNLEVYFGDNIGKTMEPGDKKEWFNFLQQLKQFAVRNDFMGFKPENLNRLKYTMRGIAAIKEGLFEGYYGKKNISYSDQPKQVRLMIKHNRNIGEGEARYRAVESLFVETAEGERFKLPFRNLAGGRIMARHVSEGGTPYDPLGQHITELVNEINILGKFIRAARNKQFGDNTNELIETAIRHYADLKAKAKRMMGHRGYQQEAESFDPAEIPNSSQTVESIRDLFIEQNVDQRIEEALPILSKLATDTTENSMKEVKAFDDWTKSVVEGTWALPDSNDTMEQLKQLMSKPLIVGADATNATEQLYDLVGDDILFDRLNDLADRDPNANCWEDPDVINRLGELGIDINPTVGPDSGEQGVTEGSQRIDSLVTDALKIMRGPAMDDAIAALKTVIGDREYNGRRGFYNFYIKQLVDMYGQQGVSEGEEHSPVAGAITRRILMQRPDLLQKYGPVAVTQAIDDVADFVGDTEEIGSSDVSGWVRQVEQSLGGVNETNKQGTPQSHQAQTTLKHLKKASYSDRADAANIKPGIAGYRDRIDMIQRAEKEGNLKDDVDENLDTDGVMMTKPSNMSSESVDPLLRLKQLMKL